MTEELHGVLTALVTPFDEHEQVNTTALHQVIDRSINAGGHGVVVGGSTGEFTSLTSEERQKLVEAVTDHVNGRVPVIAQTGSTTTADAIRHSRAAQQAGADVLMLVTPYYEPLSLEVTKNYIRSVSEHVDIPIMLYNIPDATGVNLGPDTIRMLADEIDHIQYVKDSGADWEQGLQLIHHHSDRIKTIIGWDVYAFSALTEGAVGIMAGAANVVPEQLVSVYERIAAGDLMLGLEEWKALYPIIDALISGPFIPAIKHCMGLQGLDVGNPREPMAPLSPDQAEYFKSIISSHTLAAS